MPEYLFSRPAEPQEKKPEQFLFSRPVEGKQGVPPAPPEPGVDMENPYFSSPQFQGILKKAEEQGLESLTKSEQGQIEKAIELAMVARGTFAQPQPTSREQLLEPLTQVFADASQQFAAAGDKGFFSQFGAFSKAFLKGVDSFLSKQNETGLVQAITGQEKGASQLLAEALGDAGLETVEPGKERDVYNFVTGKIEQRKITTPEAIAYNFVLGAARLAPELLTQGVDNPYDLFSGMVKFPYQEAKLILDAANISIDTGGTPMNWMVSYGLKDDEDVERARDELIRNPFGVAMLGMMALGAKGHVSKMIRSKAKPAYETVRTSGLEKIEQEIVDLQSRAAKAEEPTLTLSGVSGKVKDFPDVVLNREVKAVRPDLHVSEIAALDRRTREAIVLAKELPKAAKNEIATIKAERAPEPPPKKPPEKPPVEEPGKTVQLEPERGRRPKEGEQLTMEEPPPARPRMTQKEFDRRTKEVKQIEGDIAATEKSLQELESAIPDLPRPQKQGVEQAAQNLRNRLEADRARLEERRLPEDVEIIEEPKPVEPKPAETPTVKRSEIPEIAALEDQLAEAATAAGQPSLLAEAQALAENLGMAPDKYKMVLESQLRTAKQTRALDPELVKMGEDVGATFQGQQPESGAYEFRVEPEGANVTIPKDKFSKSELEYRVFEKKAQIATEGVRGPTPGPVKLKPPKKEPETVEKSLQEEGQPTRTETPFSEAELAMIDKSRQSPLQRNLSDSQELADWKREIQKQEAIFRKPGATKEDIAIAQQVINKAKSRIKKLESDIAARNAEQPPSESPFAGKQQFKMEKVEGLNVDAERFQGRFEPFSEESVQSMMTDYELGVFDPNNFDPIHVWNDPKTNTKVVLAGHSRLEFVKRAGIDEIPLIERDFATEAEAVKFAKDLSNRMSTKEGLAADIRAFQRMEEGSTQAQLKARFGKNYGDLRAFARLDQNGKFINAVTQRAFEDAPYVKKWARAVGEMRRELPQLTDLHEKQIFDQLYPAERSVGLYDKLQKADLRDLIDKQTSDAFWDPAMPIKLKRDPRPMRGDRARADTGPLVRKLEEAKTRRDNAATKEELEYWQNEIEKISKGIQTLVKDQGTLFGDEPGSPTFTGGGTELGFLGTPSAYADLMRGVWDTMGKVKEELKTIRDGALVPPEIARDIDAGIEAMIRHRQRVSDGKAITMQLRSQFRDWAPNEGRWPDLLNAWQQGPESAAWKTLTPSEMGVVSWLREESKALEQFAMDASLIKTPSARPKGHVYVPQMWINPKTGRPWPTRYGEFTQSSPRLRQKKISTYEAGMKEGLKPATLNAGEIIGLGYESLFRAHAARKLYQDLHNTEYSTTIQMPTKQGPRPLMMIESWKDLAENGLTEGYVVLEKSFLDSPMYYRDAKGNVRILRQKVAIRKELFDWYDAYTANYRLSTLGKLLYISKGFKLAGFFHPVQLGFQQLAMGRVPFTGIRRGLKLLERPDDNVRGLIRNGLKIHGFEDLGIDPKSVLKFEGEGPAAKVGNVATFIPREIARFIFNVVHPGMKASFAYDLYNKISPEYKYKGLSQEVAYRDAVKMADNLFSGPDYRRALLETNRLVVKMWYSAGARRLWQNSLISPSWQESHIKAFAETVGSVTPQFVRNKLRLEPKHPIAKQYRLYLAGALSLYGAANVWNYAITKHMDGEGRMMWQNEKGKEFRVRLPYDNPDGSAVYAMPFKSIFEVPEAMHSLYKTYKGEGDLRKFYSKIAPYITAAIDIFKNVDAFGRKKYDEFENPGTLAKMTRDYLYDTFAPISIVQVVESFMDPSKADYSGFIGSMGFPVSKGYPGGELGRRIDDYKRRKKAERKPTIEQVDDYILSGRPLDGILLMADELGYTDAQIRARLLKHQNALLSKWESLSEEDQYFFFKSLNEDDQQKLWQEIRKRMR